MEAPRQTPAYRLIVTLGVAGFLSGLIIVSVYEWTRPKILAHQAESLRKAVLEVLPAAKTMRPLVEVDGAWRIAPEGGATAGAGTAGAESGSGDGASGSSASAAADGADDGAAGGKEAAPFGSRYSSV